MVGLEVHAQIKTNSKLFSGSAMKFAFPANTLVSLFDCATPGTLPILNKKSVEAAVLTALALNCNVNIISEFDRKHYFYADMPVKFWVIRCKQITGSLILKLINRQDIKLHNKGFLLLLMGIWHLVFIVQQFIKQPIGRSQKLNNYNWNKTVVKVCTRTLMQGKILKQKTSFEKNGWHQINFICRSLIDLNRAGVGLMEIVFEPDLKDGEEAVALVSELVRVLEILDTCNCKMEGITL